MQTEQTLLHWACKRKLESLAVFLIDQGADIGKKDMGGRTARDIAKRKGLVTLLAYMNKVKPSTKLHSAFFIRKAARKITSHVRARLEEHK